MTGRLLDFGVEAGIIAILLLSPLPFGSAVPWAQASLEVLVAVTAAMWVTRMLVAGRLAVRVTPLLWPGVAMLALIGVQFALPGGSVSRYATWESLRLFAAYLAFLIVLSAYLVTPGRIVRLVSILVFWGVALASWGLVNRALGRELVLWLEKEWYRGRLVSTFVNANHQALYFAILLFLALGMVLRPSRRAAAPGAGTVATSLRGVGPVARILFGGAVIVLGAALVLTASRGGIAAAVTGMLAVAILALLGRVRSHVVVGLAASLGLFACYVSWLGAETLLNRFAVLAREPLGDLRWEIWRASLRIAAEAPILGVGLGTFQDAIIAYRPMGLSDRLYVDYAHNDYLQLLAEAGGLGVLVLGWATVAWLTFVVGRWRDRQDVFVRGLVMGGLGAVAAVGFHSTVDFGLHMSANALLFVAVLALLPAVVTLRAHRTGLQVDLREWRRDPGLRLRVAMGIATAGLVAVTALTLVPSAVADWKYRTTGRLVGEKQRAQGAVTMAGLAAAEGELRAAARLDPWNPRIQTEWAAVAAELGQRVWTYAVAPDGTLLRPGTVRERLVASQRFFGVAYGAYERSLRSQPRVSLNHARFGLFLNRLDAVRRTVATERLQDAVAPELAGTLGSDQSLLPRALQHLQEAVHLDPASPARRLGLVAFALAHRVEIPGAREIVAQESREAIRLDPSVLPDVARLLTAQAVEPDLLWHAVPRDSATLVDLARILEDQGRVSTAATALEDAIAIASTSSEKASVHLARARFLLRRGSGALALGQARQALVLVPGDPDAFAVLAEAYEANGLWGEAEAAIGSALAMPGGVGPQKLKEYRNRLASLVARRGDAAGVLALRRQAVQSAPNDAEAHIELARALESLRESAEAIREYDTARGLAPDHGGLQRTIAQAFLRFGLLREAAAAAERAVRLDPADDDLQVELGDLYSRMGVPDRAMEQYQQVLARQPSHQAASRGLRAVMSLQKPG